MTFKIKRYLETETRAIMVARSEARRFCCTHYVYPAEQEGKQMFYIRKVLQNKPLPLWKVRYDGDVIDLRSQKEQEA